MANRKALRETATLLLRANADINAANIQGCSFFFEKQKLSSYFNNELSNNSIIFFECTGNTPLHALVMREGALENICFFLQSGANPHIKNRVRPICCCFAYSFWVL